MATNSSALIITSPPPATAGVTTAVDIRQAKPPVAIPTGWAWLGWLLGLALVGALGWWLWRRWRRRAAQSAPVIVIPPHVRARDRLRAALELIHQPEPFCVAVSQAARVYLEERFELHAPERTTEEFLEELQHSPLLSLGQKRTLADFLMRCDLVKFARYEPGEPELRDLYEAAVRLVEETEPSHAASATVPASGTGAPPAPMPAGKT